MSSKLPSVLSATDEEIQLLLAAQCHIGTKNCDKQMEPYVWKRRVDGIHIINIGNTWEKILLAARAIVALENPADVVVVSGRTYAQCALLKFAAHTGATPIFGRFTPGSLTNQAQKNFKEPRLLIVSDPRIDHQAVTEASYGNIPVISFVNTDSPMRFVDIGIPCNNKGVKSIGLLWWLLAREVLLLRGKISRQTGFVLEDKVIMPDLYFYREEQEKAEQEEQVKQAFNEAFDTKMEVTQPTVEQKIALETAPIQDWAATSWDNQEASAPAVAPAGGNEWSTAPASGGATGW